MTFNKQKMQAMVKVDNFIKFMVNDLMGNHKEEKSLEVVFNAEVLTGGSQMQELYNSL